MGRNLSLASHIFHARLRSLEAIVIPIQVYDEYMRVNV